MRPIISIFLFCLLLIGCSKKAEKATKEVTATEQLSTKMFELQRNQTFASIQDEPIALKEFSNDIAILNDQEIQIESDLPQAYTNRLYIDKEGIAGYRGDLRNLIGLIATKDNTGKYTVGGVDFKKDSADIELKAPEGGKLKEYKYDRNQITSINWLLSVSLEDNELAHFTLEDISRAVLGTPNIDYEKITNSFKLTDQNIDRKYLIAIATVTAITSKKYTKRTRKIKVSEFPLVGSAISAGNELFTSNLEFQRDYRVGMRLIPIKSILEELPTL
ncbi:hypothetical protein [Aquimarina sp. AU474]|uniref:hypothetical protein n=1 Tax=Aquimarina sp. AU474 TaxID=2108529 RepID=UPI00135B8026|nr:hypothetical protein [Aquimarina sp. AU474]